jgi:hypothetical protein
MLVKLQLRHVLGRSDPREMKSALASLPTTLEDAYEFVMERMAKTQKEFAYKIVSWIFRSPRPLGMNELQEALVVAPGDSEVDEVCISTPTHIVQTCVGLVVYDDATNVVRFEHQSVQEFLRDYRASQLLAPAVLAETCLTYLLFDAFDEVLKDVDDLRERAQRYKFSRYAADFWSFHTKGDPEKCPRIQLLALSVLTCENKKLSMLQLRQYVHYGIFGMELRVEFGSLLHLVAEEGLATLCCLIIDGCPDGSNQYVPIL